MADLDIWRELRLIKDQLERLRKAETPIYATGTYTPTYTGATTAGATTYATQAGSYTRIGNVVVFTLYVSWTAATGTGTAVISLPLTAANVTNQFFAPPLWYAGITYGAGTGVISVIRPNTARAELWTPANNAASTAIPVEAVGEMVMTGLYFI